MRAYEPYFGAKSSRKFGKCIVLSYLFFAIVFELFLSDSGREEPAAVPLSRPGEVREGGLRAQSQPYSPQ